MPTLLEQAVAYIKAGDIEKGKQLLATVIRQNPKDENAWLWMTRCVASAAEKRYCFDQVLNINPQNQHAINGLRRLNNLVSDKTQPRRKVIRQKSAKIMGLELDTLGVLTIGGLGLCVLVLFLCPLLTPISGGVSTPTLTPLIKEIPTSTALPIVAPTKPIEPVHPAGASAICNDGTYSYSAHRRGTCSHHGGVRVWLKSLPP